MLRVIDDPEDLSAPPPKASPRTSRTLREIGVAAELLRLVTRLPDLSKHPRGSGEPVMVLPGFSAGDGSTAVLRAHLQWLGYRVRGWGLGANTGQVAKLIPRVIDAVSERARAEGAPVRLIGWSLGGYLAREAARDVPQHVDRVITLGSPVIGGPRFTTTAPIYRAAGTDFSRIDRFIEERELTPIQVPITAVYSKSDGIVEWRACIDRVSPNVEHVRVEATHIGLGFSPDVLQVVAQSLAAPRDRNARDE
jgi:pimeloyl-ACP methyl ester carboxylesterase